MLREYIARVCAQRVCVCVHTCFREEEHATSLLIRKHIYVY